jgi:hypothetical protein
MADREFKIKITSEADVSAARTEAEALKEVGRAGTSAHHDISEASEKTEVSHRALRVILGNLGPEFAHVGHEAMFAFANPVTAAAIGLTLVIGALIKRFEALNEASKALGESTSESLGNLTEGIAKATESLKESDDKFEAWSSHINNNVDGIIKRLETVKGRILETTEGSIPQKVQIEQATEAALKRAKEEEESAIESEAQARAQARNPNRAALLATLPGRIEEAKKRVKAAEAAAPETWTEAMRRGLEDEFRIGTPEENEAKWQEKFDERQRKLETEKTGLAKLESERDRLQGDQRRADAIAKEATERADKASGQVRTLTRAQEQSFAEIFSPEAQRHMEGIKEGGTPFQRDVISGEEAAAQGHALNAAQSQAIQMLTQRLKTTLENQKLINDFLKMLGDASISDKSKIEALQAQWRAARPT